MFCRCFVVIVSYIFLLDSVNCHDGSHVSESDFRANIRAFLPHFVTLKCFNEPGFESEITILQPTWSGTREHNISPSSENNAHVFQIVFRVVVVFIT